VRRAPWGLRRLHRAAGAAILTLGILCQTAITGGSAARSTRRIDIRGHEQTLQVYGLPAPNIAIVSSGDGGWVHLAPHVAEVLAAHGWYVVGFDAKAYLSSFTGSQGPLSEQDVQRDYAQLIDLVTSQRRDRPVLIGVSEGAGLAVLAGTNEIVKRRIQGVLGLGLPDISELGWRWRDMLIYVTHTTPNEPTFSAAQIVGRLAPLPLAAIHSTHDEFVSVAEINRLMARASEPKKLWTIEAADHRFSNNEQELDRRLFEALTWINQHAPQ
jgi:alpha-beta hydrolase superfamily lysophospholipase